MEDLRIPALRHGVRRGASPTQAGAAGALDAGTRRALRSREGPRRP